jgi:hypothetical protein
MWRHDDAVRIAMRLRDPESSLNGIVSVLRGWLRSAGLTLAQVIVNGRTQAQSAHSSDARQTAASSKLNTRI